MMSKVGVRKSKKNYELKERENSARHLVTTINQIKLFSYSSFKRKMKQDENNHPTESILVLYSLIFQIKECGLVIWI